MSVLALDLALSGPTGWVFWDFNRSDPVIEYGEFSCRSKYDAGVLKDYDTIKQLERNISDLIFCRPDVSYVAYEYTDWHRSLFRRGITHKQRLTEYAIERKAQWSLGMANAIIIAAVSNIRFPIANVLKIGANEAKKEFGGSSKRSIAELIAAEYPNRFRSFEHDCGHLFDELLEQPVSNNVSDAFCIAHVASGRIRLELAMDR